MKIAKLLVALAVIFTGSLALWGQTSPNLANGFTPYGSYHDGGVDSVNLMNGNLIVRIPFPQCYPQRGGLDSEFALTLNAKTWTVGSAPGTQNTWGWQPNDLAGPISSLNLYSTSIRTYEIDTSGGVQNVTTYSDYNYGIITSDGRQIGGDNPISQDSGWKLALAGIDANGTPQDGVVFDPAGNQYPIANWAGPCTTTKENDLQGAASTTVCHQSARPPNVTDPNGNVYTFFMGSPYDHDSLGRNIASFPLGPVQGFNTTSDYSDCVSPLPINSATLSNYPAANGASNQMKTCYARVIRQTFFNVAGAPDYGPDSPGTLLPVTIINPDGSKWSFQYDSYGNVTYIGLPLGGSISYQWTTVGFDQPGTAVPVSRAVTQRSITDNNGHSYTWNYHWMVQQSNPWSRNGTWTHVTTDPLGNDTVHVFTNYLQPLGACETGTFYYQGSSSSGQLLKRVDTAISPSAVSSCWPISTQTTIYPSGKVSLVTRGYDSSGYAKVVTENVYDWGVGAPGPLLRETDTTYMFQVNSAYLNAHLINLPASVVVKDGSGNRVAETDYTYDEAAYLAAYTGALPAGTHGAPPNPSPVRGNLTTVSRWLNTTNSWITSHTNWYDTGEAYQQIDPLGHTTTHSYDPAYAGGYSTQTCSPLTNGVPHCVSGTYDFSTGLLTSFTNENATAQASGTTPGDSAHTSNYTYDFMSRMTSAQAPPDPANGNSRATTSFSYSAANVFPLTVIRTRSISPTMTDSATSTYDGLGRAYQTQHLTPSGNATVDTTFDALGRVAAVSNPYFSTSDPTYGVTQSQYDALGRVTQVIKQDSSVSTVSYIDNCTIATDEAGKARRACSDALGRLTSVDEPGDSSAGASPVPSGGGTVASGSVTIAGSEQSTTVNNPPSGSGGTCKPGLNCDGGSAWRRYHHHL